MMIAHLEVVFPLTGHCSPRSHHPKSLILCGHLAPAPLQMRVMMRCTTFVFAGLCFSSHRPALDLCSEVCVAQQN